MSSSLSAQHLSGLVGSWATGKQHKSHQIANANENAFDFHSKWMQMVPSARRSILHRLQWMLVQLPEVRIPTSFFSSAEATVLRETSEGPVLGLIALHLVHDLVHFHRFGSTGCSIVFLHILIRYGLLCVAVVKTVKEAPSRRPQKSSHPSSRMDLHGPFVSGCQCSIWTACTYPRGQTASEQDSTYRNVSRSWTPRAILDPPEKRENSHTGVLPVLHSMLMAVW